jgi:hypothetical protein
MNELIVVKKTGFTEGRSLIVGVWSAIGTLARNRLGGDVPPKDLANNVMDQKPTYGPRQWEFVLAHIALTVAGRPP